MNHLLSNHYILKISIYIDFSKATLLNFTFLYFISIVTLLHHDIVTNWDLYNTTLLLIF